MKQKLALLWSRINAKKRVFVVPYTFHATCYNSLCLYCRLWSLFVSPQLKNRFVKSKRLCQRIKYRFIMCISFWQIQNRYKEMDVIRFLFYRYIESVRLTKWHQCIFSVSLKFGAYYITGQWGEFLKWCYLMLLYTFLAFFCCFSS